MADDKNSGGKGEPFLETLLSATGDVPLGISVEHETEGMVREVLKKGFPFESLDGCSERQKSAPSRTREDFALIAAVSCITAGAVFLNVARATAGEGDDWGMMSEYTFNWKDSTVFLPMGIGMRRLFDGEEECCERLRDYWAFADASLKSGYPLEENGQKAKKYFRWTLKGEGGEYVLNFNFNERSERDDIDIFFSNICRCVLTPLALMPDRPVLSWLYVDERGIPWRGFAGDSFAVRKRMTQKQETA